MGLKEQEELMITTPLSSKLKNQFPKMQRLAQCCQQRLPSQSSARFLLAAFHKYLHYERTALDADYLNILLMRSGDVILHLKTQLVYLTLL